MEQNSCQMPGGGGRGGGGSFQKRLFPSEFDNLPIFVCFLSILLQYTQMKFSITITSIYSEIHLSKSKWQMASVPFVRNKWRHHDIPAGIKDH